MLNYWSMKRKIVSVKIQREDSFNDKIKKFLKILNKEEYELIKKYIANQTKVNEKITETLSGVLEFISKITK